MIRRRFRAAHRSRAAAILAAAAIGAAHTPAAAQSADSPATPDVVVVPVLADATRAESWSFFAPRPGGGDPTYALLGNRSTLGIAARSRRFELYGAFQYAQLLGLPRRAVGPGPLGPGALYYDAARAPNAYQLYFKEHGTFFPALPSMRPSLLAGTIAQMNLRDLWGEVRLQPWRRLDVRADIHRLSLAEAADRWYSGTGATTFTGTYFGYTGRASGGATSLGTLVQARLSSPLTRRWSMRGSLGILHGGPVVRTWFAGDRLTVVALESLVAF